MGDGEGARERHLRRRLAADRMRLGSLVDWATGNGLAIGHCRPIPEKEMEFHLRRVAKAADLRGHCLDLLAEDGELGRGVRVSVTVDFA